MHIQKLTEIGIGIDGGDGFLGAFGLGGGFFAVEDFDVVKREMPLGEVNDVASKIHLDV